MASNNIKVKTTDLQKTARSYLIEAGRLKQECDLASTCLKNCKEYWKGSFSKDFSATIKEIEKTYTSVYNSCTELANFIYAAVKAYMEADAGVAPHPELVNNPDYPSNVEVPHTAYNHNGKAYNCVNGFSKENYSYYQYDEKYEGKYTKACSMFALAAAMSVLLGRKITPDDLKNAGYWGSNGLTSWSYEGKNANITKNGNLNTIYSSLKDNKPCILKFSTNGDPDSKSTHFVTAVGIREGADPNHLTKDDILVMDPAYEGGVRTLAEAEASQKAARGRTLSSWIATY